MTTQLRFAMVGAGWWAHEAHLPALAAEASIELVAVCDPDASRANAAARGLGAAGAFTDVAAMVDAIEIDCAVVATPHTTHQPIVELLLRAGVDVLVEKPLTTTAEDAWALVFFLVRKTAAPRRSELTARTGPMIAMLST